MKKLNRVAEMLAKYGITGNHLSEKLKVNKSTVTNWKKNRSQPSLERLYQIAEVLEIEPAELLVKTTKYNTPTVSEELIQKNRDWLIKFFQLSKV